MWIYQVEVEMATSEEDDIGTPRRHTEITMQYDWTRDDEDQDE